MLAGSLGFVREYKCVSGEQPRVEAWHIPAQMVREESQGRVGAGLQMPGFPSVNHITFSISMNL